MVSALERDSNTVKGGFTIWDKNKWLTLTVKPHSPYISMSRQQEMLFSIIIYKHWYWGREGAKVIVEMSLGSCGYITAMECKLITGTSFLKDN